MKIIAVYGIFGDIMGETDVLVRNITHIIT